MNLKELDSFKLSDAVTFHDKLNPKLWNSTKLRPEVRDQLIKIAEDFLQELGVHDLDVKDITISGSNAAYSYTKYSDLDLHILVDMGNLSVDEVYRELFTAKKTIYNDTHDITIHKIPVELYVQDSRQPVVSLGEYSVMNDQWIKIPTKRRSDFDQTATKSKYEKLLSLIEIALKSKKYSKVKHIIDTIKRYRQAGLDKGGEFGPENLAYKMLRSQGYITKLYDLRDKLHSEKLSFETMYQNIDEETNHWYDAGVKDAQRDAKLYPDREVKKLNPRTRSKTMQDKRARHPEEVEQYSLGYRSLKQGVAEQAVTETAEELQELTQFSKGMANFLAKSYAQYIKNPQTAKYVQQQISQPITDGAPYRALMPAIGIVSVPGADTYTSPGLELAKKFVNMVVAYFPAPGDADYNGFSEAAPAVYDARPRTVVINKDYLSDPTYLASTIAHEVQHSIDDLKSRKGLSVKTDQQDLELSYYDQGKAFKQKQSAGATNNAQKYQSYLSMPHEVNARFTEVINDIKQRIEKEDIQNIGSAGLSELARSAFNQHYMHEVFPNGAKDPGYKRLLSRVYAWLSKYYNDRIDRNGSFNPQPATPVLEEQGVAEGSLDEAFDTPLPITWEKGMHGDVDALAKLPDGSNLSIMFNKQDNIKPDDKTWMVEFYRNNSQEVTGEGDAQKVFSTVLVAIQQFITKYKPLKIYFSASKEVEPGQNSESRSKLYDRLVLRYANSLGYKFFRADNGSSVMYQLSRIPKQKAVGEDYTMQFAVEKTPPVSPYAGVKDNQYRGGISEASGKKISFKVQKGNGKFSTTLTVNNTPAGIYQYDSNTGRSIAEVYPEFKGKGLGKLLVLHAIYTAAQLGLDFQEDESRTRAYDNVLDSLSSNGYIVDDDGYWYVTGEGEQYLKQSLNEASGYIPSKKQKNDPRYSTALTVDVHPDSIKKNAKAFYWNTSRAGIPPTAKANGKI